MPTNMNLEIKQGNTKLTAEVEKVSKWIDEVTHYMKEFNKNFNLLRDELHAMSMGNIGESSLSTYV